MNSNQEPIDDDTFETLSVECCLLEPPIWLINYFFLFGIYIEKIKFLQELR